MKLFTKISLIAAAIALGLGCLGIVTGLAMGADAGDLSEMGIYITPHQQVQVAILEKNHHKNEHYEDEIHNKDLNYHHSNSIQEIEALEIEVENADITIIGVSEAVNINYFSNREKNLFKVEGTTLKIEDKKVSKIPTILEIYVPVGVLNKIEIDMEAGELSADRIIADNFSINMAAGSVQIDELIVTGEADLQVDAGKMIIGYYDGTKLDAECAMGSIMVVCEGNQDDYNYEMECGMGQIVFGQESYSGLGEEIYIDNRSSKLIGASCDMGEIMLEFPNSL